MANRSNDPEETVFLELAIDRETADRLLELSRFCQADPNTIAASLLHDILADDEAANIPTAVAAGHGVTKH